MIGSLLFNKTMGYLEKGLDAASLRNDVIANNLANVETPGFKRSDVNFEDELRKAMNNQDFSIAGTLTNQKHIPIGTAQGIDGVTPKVVQENDTSIRNDGNNVDIDKENATLAKNTIMYYAMTQELNDELQKLKSAISEGRR